MTATAPATSTAIAAVDAIFDRFHATLVAPGVVFGVIVDGSLVHSGSRGSIRPIEAADGTVAVVEPGAAPDDDTGYRIASMTKSFTAAAILRLRDDGRLRLDDDARQWVPELDGGARWADDAGPMTIRALLTMSAGLPTDDPWGDRQLGLDEASFLRFLAAGPELTWPVGTHFEYSNTGYAILGLIVGRAAGEAYRTFVERRVLEPLGLAGTAFDTTGVEAGRVAPGYLRRGGAWIEEPIAPHGAYAPMGGLYSTVRDLATWVAAFLAASPSRDDDDRGVLLSRASLREMQESHRAIPPELRWTSTGAPPVPFVSGYGYGLFVVHDVERGRTITHSGGLPGYGSNMRWHPASGLGVVAAANGRYAPLGLVCRDALNALIDGGTRPARRPRPWPATEAARSAVEQLIEDWDDDLAKRTFAINVDLDEPLELRRAQIDGLRATFGRLRPDESEPAIGDTPAALRWWLRGERGGRVQVDIQLGPERPARVQWLELVAVPDPSPRLLALAERVTALVSQDRAAWPADLELAAGVDRAAVRRDLRAADALFGPLTLGAVTAGDGASTGSWRLNGPRGPVTLTIALAEDGATIETIALVPDALESPIEGV
ncbi:MAG TPA: serine hydrolase domain-containing protein [Candidatus Limnocylindrales bacterium]|nr:serine hydrolase domain-containing protein [Candidatus Limnocylindrales bacterium]